MAGTLIRTLLRAQAGEERAVGLAFAYFFVLMCSYYLLRPLRDALAIDTGLENLPKLYLGTFTAMLLLTPFYGALVEFLIGSHSRLQKSGSFLVTRFSSCFSVL